MFFNALSFVFWHYSKKQKPRDKKRNPLRNLHAKLRLNPYAAVVREEGIEREKKALAARAARVKAREVLPLPYSHRYTVVL